MPTNSSATTSVTSSVTTTSATKPLFYNAPEALSRVAHANLKVVVSGDFSFARNTSSVPLAISEFSAASGHYPIAFLSVKGDTKPSMPVALLSIAQDKNDYIDSEGHWRKGSYVPAYVRRYPFAFASDESSGNLVLCADLASDRISTSEGAPLFNNGEPTEATTRMLGFCTSYQQDYVATEQFVTVLGQMNLLREQRLVLRGASGSRTLAGLRLLDRTAFRKLDDASFLRLRSLGYLGPIYAHLASLHRLREFSI